MTTDIESLIRRLDVATSYHSVCGEAADALRSQAKRIQALEAKCALLAASLAQSEKEVEDLKRDVSQYIKISSEEAARADTMEAKCAELERDAPRWISVEDQLPNSGKTVLATYLNRIGKLRRIRAQYIAPKTREQNVEHDELDGEYDEATDTYYWTAGWYECIDNWCDYSHVAVCEGSVTHWMPMPDAAIAALAGSKEPSK
jgi:NTP pyrophosphatase (non-canonical NTP hydrolase)